MSIVPIPERLLPYRHLQQEKMAVIYEHSHDRQTDLSSIWRPELGLQSVLRPFTVSPYAVVHDINERIDLTDSRERHIVLDHPDTELHDDAVLVKKIAPNLYDIAISVPAASYDAYTDFSRLPVQFSARAKSNHSLRTGVREAFSIRALVDDERNVHDFFAFHSTIRTHTYAHRERFETDENGIVTYLPSMHDIIPPGYAAILCEATQSPTTEEAIKQLMYLQWLGISLLAIQKGEPVPHAQLVRERMAVNDRVVPIDYLSYTSRPVAGADNVVAASSPLRRRRDLIGLSQAEAICDRSLTLLPEHTMDDITAILSRDARTRAIGTAWKVA